MGHFQKHLGIFKVSADVCAGVQKVGQDSLFFEHLGGFFRIIPEVGPGNEMFQLLEASFFYRQVKDTP
jgi:hypothetical protein